MRNTTEKSGDLLDVMVDRQDVETGTTLYTKDEIPKANNSLTKTMLKVIRLEAKKNSLIQQMIAESVKKEDVHLRPEELATFSRHLNRYVEAEERALNQGILLRALLWSNGIAF